MFWTKYNKVQLIHIMKLQLKTTLKISHLGLFLFSALQISHSINMLNSSASSILYPGESLGNRECLSSFRKTQITWNFSYHILQYSYNSHFLLFWNNASFWHSRKNTTRNYEPGSVMENNTKYIMKPPWALCS